MSTQEVRSTGPGAASGQERARIGLLAVLIVVGVAGYLFVRGGDGDDDRKNLLPYQLLATTLSDSAQQTHSSLRQGLIAAESDRARLKRWPEADTLREHGVAPFDGTGSVGLTWHSFTQSTTINYIGIPADGTDPAWILAIQEPESGAPADPSPNDDEHHRLPDGTTLHIYVWMHRFGGRVKPVFVPQPQAEGWVQVFSAPPNPLFPVRP